jgi:hypothetical protein
MIYIVMYVDWDDFRLLLATLNKTKAIDLRDKNIKNHVIEVWENDTLITNNLK